VQTDPPTAQSEPRFCALSSIQRRIVGVLVEKAKTTPDAYPLSLNALTSGCNQKSNRSPQMNLSAEEVEETLEQLRDMQAVAEVHGDGRVARYRHYMKDWLGVDGTELAVMAELLLRGTQTVGELRGRAARMASGQLPDMSSLRPVLQSLIEKKLVVPITPAGRGQVVTHGIYPERELQRILNEQRSGSPAASATAVNLDHRPPEPATTSAPIANQTTVANKAGASAEFAQLQEEVSQLREELARVKKDLADLWSNLQ
jgi:uncharacterized protein YceH (UPF0502 family)